MAKRPTVEEHQAEQDVAGGPISRDEDQDLLDQGMSPPTPEAAPKEPEPWRAIVAQVATRFLQAVPDNAHARGGYDYPEDDGEPRDVPDGKYRIDGTEWVFEWEGGKPKSAFKATAPEWGGEDVKTVTLDTPR